MGKWNLGRRNKRECVRFITYKKEPPLESNLDDMPNSKIHRYTESSEIRFPSQGARTEFSYFSFYFDTGSKAHKPEGTDSAYWNVQRRHVIGRGWKKGPHSIRPTPLTPSPNPEPNFISVQTRCNSKDEDDSSPGGCPSESLKYKRTPLAVCHNPTIVSTRTANQHIVTLHPVCTQNMMISHC